MSASSCEEGVYSDCWECDDRVMTLSKEQDKTRDWDLRGNQSDTQAVPRGIKWRAHSLMLKQALEGLTLPQTWIKQIL